MNGFPLLMTTFLLALWNTKRMSSGVAGLRRDPPRDAEGMAMAELRSRGRELRRVLERTYLESRMASMPSSDGSTAIGHIVSLYLQPGDSFDRVETLLLGARMSLVAVPTRAPASSPSRGASATALMTFRRTFLAGQSGLALFLHLDCDDGPLRLDRIDVRFFHFA